MLEIFKAVIYNNSVIGVSPSGKATDSDSVIRVFESLHPSQSELIRTLLISSFYICQVEYIMITFRFIEYAKYHMGCLGFRPKKIENFDKQTLKDLVVDKIFRLKDIGEAFSLNYHYTWIVKHWKKLLKALAHDKWQNEIPYSTIDVSLCKDKYDNISFTTNMFDNSYEGFSLDENGKVISSVFAKKLKKDKYPVVDIVHDNDRNMDFVYPTKYLNELKKKKYADPKYSIASIELICLDYKTNKYISYIIYNTEKINELAILDCANKSLQNEVNKKVQMQSFVVASNMMMLHTIQRMNLNRINSFNINRFNRF